MSYQQSRDSSSSARYSESHRCERLWDVRRTSLDERRISNSGRRRRRHPLQGVIKESEMTLEWAAEQPTEITRTAIDLEFLPTDTKGDRGVQNLEFVLQQTHSALMPLASYEANDTVANSQKNPLKARRRLQKRYDPTTGGRKRICARSFLLDCALFWYSQGVSHVGSPACLVTIRR